MTISIYTYSCNTRCTYHKNTFPLYELKLDNFQMYICICWINPYSTIFCYFFKHVFWMCKQIGIYISFQISYLFVFLLYCTKCDVIVFVLVYHVIFCFPQLYCILFYGIYFLKVVFSWYLKNRMVFESSFTAFFQTENSGLSGLSIVFWACVKTSIWMVFACRPLTAARLVQAGSDWALKLI